MSHIISHCKKIPDFLVLNVEILNDESGMYKQAPAGEKLWEKYENVKGVKKANILCQVQVVVLHMESEDGVC